MRKPNERKRAVLVESAVWAVLGTAAYAGPPLPAHQLEGNSGGFLTPMAYMANPAEPNTVFGRPSVSGTYAHLEEKDVEALVVTENLWGRVELGYGLVRTGLGDWPDEVRAATGFRVQDQAFTHNFNARLMVIKEGSFDHPWMPAVTLGAHLKWAQDLDDINEQVGGGIARQGGDHDTGIEFTAVATKRIKGVLPGPLIFSAGLRNGDAIQAGLLGFAGERKTTLEGSIVTFLTEKLLVAAEYRQIPHQIQPLTVAGRDLVKSEGDWWDISLTYVVNDRITASVGYANVGNILNNREDNVRAVQVKYEF